ncbi:HIT-like domain-containing protein [Pelagophyceae sp. CCMP2097]|nr:HIT-like domain-containing protein [Pelagophyceae sp. CCMP2097]
MDADGVHATTGGPCGHCLSARGRKGPILWQDEHFVVVHKGAPCGVVGHFMLVSKRHFQGPSLMTDAEAAALGPALKRCEAAVEKATKCDRVYTAALGSKGAPHFHAHMMPLYVGDSGAGDAPKAVTGSSWDVFLQEKLAADGAFFLPCFDPQAVS